MMMQRLVLVGSLLLVALPASAGPMEGKVVEARGGVFAQPPGGSEAATKTGAVLAAGTRVRTAADGHLLLSFDDSSQLRLEASSTVLLSSYPRKRAQKTSVVLFFGRVWSKVSRSISGETSFEVNTPNAVCGVRGTEFETAVADDGSVRVRVSEGKVSVADDGDEALVEEGDEVEATDEEVGDASDAEEQAKWEAWQKQKSDRVKAGGKQVIDRVGTSVKQRQQKIEALRARQQEIETKRKSAEERLRSGESNAADEIRGYNQQLAELADAIADIGDMAQAQFGFVDHLADLAADPRFRMVDRKYLESQAASLRKVKAMFDRMVKEGTDISMEAMDKMLDDLGKGQRGTLKDKRGSSVEDMFDKGDMDMDDMRP
ncbi:MAG: FecR domain-containing protein [Myxococcota bacterium]|mgnify:CR=1 FL=1